MPLMVELPPNGGPILSKGGAVHVAISRIFGLGYASGVGVWRIWDDPNNVTESNQKKSTPYDTMRWIDIDAHGWFDYGDHGTTRRVVRRSGSVVSDHMRSRKTTTASQTSFEELMWRRADVETASVVGRTLWAAGSRRTGEIEAKGGTPKFGPKDSC